MKTKKIKIIKDRKKLLFINNILEKDIIEELEKKLKVDFIFFENLKEISEVKSIKELFLIIIFCDREVHKKNHEILMKIREELDLKDIGKVIFFMGNYACDKHMESDIKVNNLEVNIEKDILKRIVAENINENIKIYEYKKSLDLNRHYYYILKEFNKMVHLSEFISSADKYLSWLFFMNENVKGILFEYRDDSFKVLNDNLKKIKNEKFIKEKIEYLNENNLILYSEDDLLIRFNIDKYKNIYLYYDKGLEIDESSYDMLEVLIENVIVVYENLMMKYEINIVKKEMETVNKELVLAKKSKNYFLANMSHELRTPLNGLVGVVELLMETRLNEAQEEYVDMINRSSENLLNIINELLEYTRVQSENFKVRNAYFNLKAMLNRIEKNFFLKKKENIDFVVEIKDDVPEKLKGDQFITQSILEHVINNSFKFTESGKVEVKVSKVKEENEILSIEFLIKDSGIGIEEEKIKAIFEKFIQLDLSKTKNYGGIGIGLSIVEKLIDLIHGTIDVKSFKDNGTEFRVVIDFDVSKDKPISNLKILVAEDNILNQIMLRKMLENKGWEVEIANNGEEVLKKIENVSYDLILMDIQMPKLDGLKTTQIIRTMEQNSKKHIPIIAVTAYALKDDRKTCLNVGMDDYMAKPVKLAELEEKIEKNIYKKL